MHFFYFICTLSFIIMYVTNVLIIIVYLVVVYSNCSIKLFKGQNNKTNEGSSTTSHSASTINTASSYDYNFMKRSVMIQVGKF